MDSSFDLDLDLDLDSFPLISPSDDLSSVFLKEDIDNIDEEWWQGLCQPSPSRFVEDLPSSAPEAGDDETVTTDAPASSSHSSHSPTTHFNPDAAAATSSPEVAGSKRSADSSPETDQDDPKRVRRCVFRFRLRYSYDDFKSGFRSRFGMFEVMLKNIK